ncbi:hypothetical protein AZ15_0591 [Bordetella bronchiseptica A1-7]|nr:hypothetical protein AZ15_0591 [Bordetella bronchiseptica A1-7]
MGSSIFRRAVPVLAMLAFSAFCAHAGAAPFPNKEIGRASCRERV